eukprot:gene11907-15006_t
MADYEVAEYYPCDEDQFMTIAALFSVNGNETATALCANLKTEDLDTDGIKYGMNSMWIVLCGAMVFLMSCAFSFSSIVVRIASYALSDRNDPRFWPENGRELLARDGLQTDWSLKIPP